MTALFLPTIALLMVATAFLSGLFGMAGGLVLIGMLLLVMPVPVAMALHALTQMVSNAARAAMWWRRIRWPVAAAYISGCLAALLPWSLTAWVPSVPVALVCLGVVPFLSWAIPPRWQPVPERPVHGVAFGALCMTLMLLTGVAGPVLDRFFLNGTLDRREIVATKGVCQVCGHGFKLAYFGSLAAAGAAVDPWLCAVAVAATLTGTALSRQALERMSDDRYRRWAGNLVTAISGYYVLYGGWLAVTA